MVRRKRKTMEERACFAGNQLAILGQGNLVQCVIGRDGGQQQQQRQSLQLCGACLF